MIPTNNFVLGRTVQNSAEHTAPALEYHTSFYGSDDNISKLSSTAQDTQGRPDFATGSNHKKKETPTSQWVHLLLQHDLESPYGQTKIRWKTPGVSKLELVNPLPSLSEPIASYNSLFIGPAVYERFLEALQSRTIDHQPNHR